MIRLQRPRRPQALRTNATAWKKEFIVWRAHPSPRPRDPRRYKNSAIKNALRGASFAKCAYCESHLEHVYPADVEHILPKSARPALVVEWGNLAWVCFECNNRKGIYYSTTVPLVDPYSEDPSDHLFFAGDLCVWKPGSERGRLTVTQLALSRSPLVERRRERLQQLGSLLDLWMKTTDPLAKAAVRAEAEAFGQPSAEYAAACAAYLRLCAPW